jgi:hypothetical protein
MLVIANGANKCGSTWLTSIVLELVQPRKLPKAYHDERHGAIPTIRGDMIRRFLDRVDYRNVDYVSKNHFYYERPLLARYSNVYLIDIERDLPDMLISLFFHASPEMAQASVEHVREAYWQFGAPIVEYVVRYHAQWKRLPWAYMSSYERLKNDCHAEIAAMAAFLKIPTPPERIEAVIRETGFRRLAEKLSGIQGMERRFRKGVVGDHKNYFDEPVLADIRRIEAQNREFPRTWLERCRFALDCRRFGGRNQPPPYQQKLAAAMRRHAAA